LEIDDGVVGITGNFLSKNSSEGMDFSFGVPNRGGRVCGGGGGDPDVTASCVCVE